MFALTNGLSGLRCWWAGRFLRGVKRVDADSDGKQLAQMLAQRHNQISNRAAITGRVSGRPVAVARRILHHLFGDKRVRASHTDRIVTGSDASLVRLAGLRCL